MRNQIAQGIVYGVIGLTLIAFSAANLVNHNWLTGILYFILFVILMNI